MPKGILERAILKNFAKCSGLDFSAYNFPKKKTQSQVFQKQLSGGILKNFSKLLRKHLCWSLFLIKLHRYFPLKFAKFLRIAFLQNTSRRLLLVFTMTLQNFSEHMFSRPQKNSASEEIAYKSKSKRKLSHHD